MTNTDDTSPNKSSDANSAWETLPTIQQRHVAGLVANAIKRDDFGSGDFEHLCNALAAAMLRDHTVDPATLLSAVMPSQREVRERIEDSAVTAADDLLLPDNWQVKIAQEKLAKMPEDDRAIIEAAVDAAHKANRPKHWRNRTAIAGARDRDRLFVSIISDEGAVARILAQAKEGRESIPER